MTQSRKSSRTPSEATPAQTRSRSSLHKPTAASRAKSVDVPTNESLFLDAAQGASVPGSSQDPAPKKVENKGTLPPMSHGPIYPDSKPQGGEFAKPLSGRLARNEVQDLCASMDEALKAQVYQDLDLIRDNLAQADLRITDQEERILKFRVALEKLQSRIDEAPASGNPGESLLTDVQTLRGDVNKLLEKKDPCGEPPFDFAEAQGAVLQQLAHRLEKIEARTSYLDPIVENAHVEVLDPNVPDEPNFSSSKKHQSRTGKGRRGDPKRRGSRSGPSSSSSEASSDSDSSVDELVSRGHDHRLSSRPKGPKYRGLKELRPTNPVFDKLMSYRNYRLTDTTQYRTRHQTGKVWDLIKRLEVTMKDYCFTGGDPILIFEFLNRFVDEADMLDMTEAQAFITLPYFLKGYAHEQFRTIKDASTAAEGGVTSWPEAVQYLLRSYATSDIISSATLALRSLRQKFDETEMDY